MSDIFKLYEFIEELSIKQNHKVFFAVYSIVDDGVEVFIAENEQEGFDFEDLDNLEEFFKKEELLPYWVGESKLPTLKTIRWMNTMSERDINDYVMHRGSTLTGKISGTIIGSPFITTSTSTSTFTTSPSTIYSLKNARDIISIINTV